MSEKVIVSLSEAAWSLGIDRDFARQLMKSLGLPILPNPNPNGGDDLVLVSALEKLLRLRQLEQLRQASTRREQADREWREAIYAATNLTLAEVGGATGLSRSRVRYILGRPKATDFAPPLSNGRKAYLCGSRNRGPAIIYGKSLDDAKERFRQKCSEPSTRGRRATRADMQAHGGWWGGADPAEVPAGGKS